MTDRIPTIMTADAMVSREKMTRREKNLRKAVQKAIDAKSLKDAREVLQAAMDITPAELLFNEASEEEAAKVRQVETATEAAVEER